MNEADGGMTEAVAAGTESGTVKQLAPIGVFDSGEGGLTVARALDELLPGHPIIYACDTAHFPYGGRSLAEVRGFFASFVEFFHQQGCGMVVAACNTATTAALLSPDAPAHWPVPVVGVVEPGARAAARMSMTGRIGVVATEATCRAGIYERLILRQRPDARVFQQACPALITMAEAGEVAGNATQIEARRCVAPLLAAGIDTLVLGCTHLPHMRRAIADEVGAVVRLVDPGLETARLLREQMQWAESAPAGDRRFFCTGDPDRFAAVANQLWPGVVQGVQRLRLWDTQQPASIVLATRNPGKVRELRAMLADTEIAVLGLDDCPAVPEVEEIGTTFEANALQKGRVYCKALGRPVMAEDSGIEVDALGREPGVHSARWIPGSDEDRTRHLLAQMAQVPPDGRVARYVSVVAVVRPDGVERVFRGTCEGRVGYEFRGTGGFGYDPVFVTGDGRTMAELRPEEKNAISHRSRAIAQALQVLPQLLQSNGVTQSGG